VNVRTKRHSHEVGKVIAYGDVCDVYESTTDGSTKTVVKLARVPSDNDLMEAEASALRILCEADAEFRPFIPTLVDSFAYRGKGSSRRANVLERLDGWCSLEDVASAYPGGIDPLDVVWMWRRLLWALGYVHGQGLVHGAIVPSNVMILPDDHGLMLIDWCYSVRSGSRVKAVASQYSFSYPPEVRGKRAASSATDIYMAARVMMGLSEMPAAMSRFLRGCCQEEQRRRPADAWALGEEFERVVLQRLGHPYWPRRFHKFSMPTAVAD
jgi:serine/threonine protein kinase